MLAARPASIGGPATAIGQWLKTELPAERGGLVANGGEPTLALELLRDAAQDASRVGEEEVRGVATTRYAVTLDLDRYATTLGVQARGMMQQLEIGGRVRAAMWADAQDRLRRLRTRFGTTVHPMDGTGTTSRSVTDLTFELFDFGVPVQVTPPPADKVCTGPSC
jgi:hypothetical protein